MISSGGVVPGLRKKLVVLADGASENERLALPVDCMPSFRAE